MELNSTEISILALLRAALMQQEPVLPQDVDWNAVYAEAELQAITPLLASKLPHSLAETEQARWERRGLSVLRTCDAVIYDALIDPSLLESCPPDAERIYVGKRRGKHSLTPEEI